MYSKLITSVATLALILPTLAGTADARSSFGGGHSAFSGRSFTPAARTARPQQRAIARPNASVATTRPMRTRNTVQLTPTNPAGASVRKDQTRLAMHTRSGTFGVNNGAGAIFGGTHANPPAAPANPAGGPIKLGANSVPATSTMNPTSGNASGTSIVANTPPPHGTAIGTAANPSGGPIKLGANSVPTTSSMNSRLGGGAVTSIHANTPPSNGSTPTGGGSTPTGGGSTPTGGGSTPTGGGSTPTGGGSTPTGGGSTPTGGGSTPTGGGSTQTGGGSTPVDPGMGGGDRQRPDRIVIPGQRRFPPAIGGPVATIAPNVLMPLPQPVVVQRRVTTAQPQACLVKEYLRGAVMFKDVCTNEWALNASDGVLKASAGNCLTKGYPQANVVLFKDVCTNEWAMNPPPAH